VSNILMAIPILLVTGGVAAPLLLLDGKSAYMNFLWRNPNLGHGQRGWVGHPLLLAHAAGRGPGPPAHDGRQAPGGE
jgi:hypothetical protein